MKLLIAGSRDITDFDLSKHIPDGVDLIITGGARGIDTLAEKYADEHNIEKLIFRPEYNKYGKAAPLKRNEEMVNMADEILVVWNGASRGSRHTIKYAQKMQKKITIL